LATANRNLADSQKKFKFAEQQLEEVKKKKDELEFKMMKFKELLRKKEQNL
jgi:hypothetical protein